MNQDLDPGAVVKKSDLLKLRDFASLRTGVRLGLTLLWFSVSSLIGLSASAADNELTPQEKADGWVLLFNGHDLKGWKNNDGSPVRAKIEEGAINVHGTGGYLLVYDEPFDDFVFECDVKMDRPFCNSGIFLRTGDLADPVQSAIEVQILSDSKPGMNSFASLYDLVAASKNASHGVGEWDSFEIRCEGPKITVSVNGEQVNSIDCDEWTEPGRRPDGSRHKFQKAIKDFPRTGHLGLQDHGYNAWFKNIKLKKL